MEWFLWCVFWSSVGIALGVVIYFILDHFHFYREIQKDLDEIKNGSIYDDELHIWIRRDPKTNTWIRTR